MARSNMARSARHMAFTLGSTSTTSLTAGVCWRGHWPQEVMVFIRIPATQPSHWFGFSWSKCKGANIWHFIWHSFTHLPSGWWRGSWHMTPPLAAGRRERCPDCRCGLCVHIGAQRRWDRGHKINCGVKQTSKSSLCMSLIKDFIYYCVRM